MDHDRSPIPMGFDRTAYRITELPPPWDATLAKSIVEKVSKLNARDNEVIEVYLRELIVAGVNPMDIELVICEEQSADAITHVYSVRPRSSEPVVLSPED